MTFLTLTRRQFSLTDCFFMFLKFAGTLQKESAIYPITKLSAQPLADLTVINLLANPPFLCLDLEELGHADGDGDEHGGKDVEKLGPVPLAAPGGRGGAIQYT